MNRPWVPKGHDLDTTNPPREFTAITDRPPDIRDLPKGSFTSITLAPTPEVNELRATIARLEKRIQELECLLSKEHTITVRVEPKYLEE